MRDFFKGWRRKVGVVLLGLACGLTSLWLFTATGYFATKIVMNDQSYLLMSHSGHFECVTFDRGFHPMDYFFDDYPILASLKRDWVLFGLHHQILGSVGRTLLRVHYAIVAVPLTFLSAYLLLCPQRKPKRETEQAGR